MPFKATLTLTRSDPIIGGKPHSRADDEIIVAPTPCLPKKHLEGVADRRFCPMTVTVEDPRAGPVDGEILSTVARCM